MDEAIAYIKLFLREYCGNGWLPLILGILVIVINVFFSGDHKGSIGWILVGGALVIFGIGQISGMGVFQNLII